MIDMLMNASVTGGIVILLWYLTYPLSRKYFKASWHYAVLKITMIFMLLPVGVFAPLLNNVFAQPSLHIYEQIQRVSIDAETIDTVNTALSDFVLPFVQYSPQSPQTDNVIETTDSITYEPVNAVPDIPYLQIIWLVVAVTVFSSGIHKMHRFKKQIINTSSSSVEHETQELFLQCRKQLGVHGKITLRTSGHTKTPFVFGLIYPIIILPETGMNTDEKRLAFIHELTHIKNGDLWLKFIAFVISVIHWFSPFTHLLCRKISLVSEEYCDECVVKTMTQDERFLYGNLILKVVTDMRVSAPHSKFCSTLSAPTKNIKRRLSNMLNTKKSRKSTVALSVIAAFILCSLATVYAFAANVVEVDSDTPISVNDTLDLLIPTKTNIDLTDYTNNHSEQYETKIDWAEIPGEIGWSDKYGEIKWLTYEDYIKVIELVGPSFYVDNGTIRPFALSAERIVKAIEDCESTCERIKNGTVQSVITMNWIIGSGF